MNRHWADDVYRGVAPITMEEDGQLALEGKGSPVEWVVVMRRLSEADSLKSRLKRDQVSLREAETLANYLVAKYEKVPVAPISPLGYAQRVRAHQRANSQDLLGRVSATEKYQVLRIQSALAGFLWTSRELLEERVERGCIVEGHGDLRPEHIYLESPPRVIDGIEFSRDLRTLDILDELCFLEMECELVRGHHVSRALDTCYRRFFEDDPPHALIDFYKAYRALVRAKVDALRLAQDPDNIDKRVSRDLHRHLARADHYAQKLGRPWLVVVCGLMGSGKSTLASAIADVAGAKLIQTDRIRQNLVGVSSSAAEYGGGNYSREARERVYDSLFDETVSSLDNGISVVADGTFLSQSVRRNIVDLARQRLAPVQFVQCQAPRSIVLERLEMRQLDSDCESEARPDLYDQQATEEAAFDPAIPRIDIDTTAPECEQIEEVRCELVSTNS